MKAAALILCLALAGCAQKKPQRVQPADFSKVQTQHATAQAGLAEAKEHSGRAAKAIDTNKAAVGRAKTGVTLQREAVAKLTPAIATLAQNVPMELRPEVEALGEQVKIVSVRLEEVATATEEAAKAAETAALETVLGQQAAARAETAIASAAVSLDIAKQRDAENTAIANANADLAESEKTAKLKAEKRTLIVTGIAGVALLSCAIMAYLLFKP